MPVSETVHRFRLSELSAFRIVCQNPGCKSVCEVSLERLGKILRAGDCPFCGTTLLDPNKQQGQAYLSALADAIRNLIDREDKVAVEVVLPSK